MPVDIRPRSEHDSAPFETQYSQEHHLNNSRRIFLGKAPAVAVAAGVGVASGKLAIASPSNGGDSTRHLLDAVIEGQGEYNGFLSAADELMLDVLRMIIPHVPGIDQAAATAKLNQAGGYVDKVPGKVPPYCELPEGFDPNS